MRALGGVSVVSRPYIHAFDHSDASAVHLQLSIDDVSAAAAAAAAAAVDVSRALRAVTIRVCYRWRREMRLDSFAIELSDEKDWIQQTHLEFIYAVVHRLHPLLSR